MRDLKFHELIEEWLGRHRDLYHFFVNTREYPGASYHTICCYHTPAHFGMIHGDKFKSSIEDVEVILAASDPKFFDKLAEHLTFLHIKHLGKWRTNG